jgi:NhaA family Na+:H+ antiporter
MSIFVAQLAFEGQDELLLMAKTGILGASFLAGVTGFVWLYLVGNPPPDTEQQAERRRPMQKQEIS